MLKKIKLFVALMALCVGISIPVVAAPTDTYTRFDVPGGTNELSLSREMYSVDKKINASSLGLSEPLEKITDICTGNNGTIFILCSEPARIVCLNSDYTLKRILNITDKNGQAVNYVGAEGIYQDISGDIYVSDTKNSRVLVCNENGLVKQILEKPDSNLVPADFIYSPIAVERDAKGYTYILSDGCYYGALLYSPYFEFMGFYGSNTVKTTALDTLSYLWDKLTSTETKKSNSLKTLPYSFNDFCLDADGYLITCTGTIEKEDNGKGQIRMISPTGKNILYKRNLRGGTNSSDAVNFLENQPTRRVYNSGDSYMAQNIISIAVNDNTFIFALDNTNGTIYVFDSECNLLSAFGGGKGSGKQRGTFQTPVALTLSGDSLLVADSDDMSITVFNATEYAKLIYRAQELYLKGNYEEARPLWSSVLKSDCNNQLAYRGLAMAYYSDGNYREALNAARIASDYTVYDLTWSAMLSDFIAHNFIWMLAVLCALIGLIIFVVLKLKKSDKKINVNPKLKLTFDTIIHPFRGFEAVKYRNMGSIKIAIVLTFFLYLSFYLRETASGFLYRETTVGTYNSLFTLSSTVGMLMLFVISNFLICSQFSGKGSLKEIYIATIYSLLPIIIYKFLCVLLTNFLPLSAAGFINGLGTAVTIYSLFLLCIALITIHEYDFFKLFLTTLAVIIMMILIAFAIFLCAILLTQAFDFVKSIFVEMQYR